MSSSNDNSKDRDRGEKRRGRPRLRLDESKKARRLDESSERARENRNRLSPDITLAHKRAPGKRNTLSPDITNFERAGSNLFSCGLRSQNKSGYPNPYKDHTPARRIVPSTRISSRPSAAAGAPHQLNNERQSGLVQPTAGSSLSIQGQINVDRADSSGHHLEFSTNAQINLQNHITGVTLQTNGVNSETKAANEQSTMKPEESPSNTSGEAVLKLARKWEEDNDVYVDAPETLEELIPHTNVENERASNSGTDESRSAENREIKTKRSNSDSELDAVSENSSTTGSKSRCCIV